MATTTKKSAGTRRLRAKAPSEVPTPASARLTEDPTPIGGMEALANQSLRQIAQVLVGATRGVRPAKLKVGDLARAQLLEVHFSDGSTLYTAPQTFLRDHVAAPVGVGTKRGGGPPLADDVELPLAIDSTNTTRRRSGAMSAQVARYAISELTPPTGLDKVIDFAAGLDKALNRWLGGQTGTAATAARMVTEICALYENSTLDPAARAAGGALLAWQRDRFEAVGTGSIDPGTRPVLLLLHGTASSTRGSFKGLWNEIEHQGEDSLPDDFKRLAQSHCIVAWDHRSLTLSPIDNTIEMLRALQSALPARCRIDVVSHSRGGLVGELFALRGAEGASAAATVFEATFKTLRNPDASQLAELFTLLEQAGKRWTAGTYVRVACPARGTLLADGRTDLFLSLLLRSLSLVPGGAVAKALLNQATTLVKSLVAARADARTVPGLEAMIPGSALTLALDRCDARAADRLRVIAGDAKARGLSGLLTLMADVFYGWHDHDWVVHTRSMFGGLKRRAQAPLSLRVEDAAITHFAYFGIDASTRPGMMAALAGGDQGFGPIDVDERRTRSGPRGPLQALLPNALSERTAEQWLEAAARWPTNGKPVLVVLPGIMGSQLRRSDGSTVWLSADAMLGGGMRDLALDASRGLVAGGLLAVSYERLIRRAQSAFNVVALGYDWRRPIAVGGARLQDILKQVLDKFTGPTQPVHLVAHSMGGLIARHALFVDPSDKLWERIRARGGRLLMLGTPNCGSYAPARMLAGQDSFAKILALAATRLSHRELADFAGSFQGLLEMLPQEPDPNVGDLFAASTWTELQQIDSTLVVPDAATLKAARDYVFGAPFQDSWQRLRADPGVLYVAGQGETALELRKRQDAWRSVGDGSLTPTPGLEFLVGADGDGTVPWTSRLEPARTWYAPCEHGTLADHVDSFDAYFALLTTGDTQALRRLPAAARGAEAQIATLRSRSPVPAPALLPASDDELAAYLLQSQDSALAEAVTIEPIELRLVHGGLDYARFPLLVGHQAGEPLSGATRRVNEKLGGQLQRVLDLRLFAGASRTGHYLRPNSPDGSAPAYPGAIVLGLGPIGELTPGVLAETVTRGVLRYAFEHLHRDAYAPRGDLPVELRLSSLLLGTQLNAISVGDSLAGLLRGLWRAAQIGARMFGTRRPVLIREIEIIEIDETKALDAAYELDRMLSRGEWPQRFHWSARVLEPREGRTHGYRRGSGGSTWQRLMVQQDEFGGMNYSLIGSQARVEASKVQTDVSSLRGFIDRVSDDRAAPGDAFASALDPALGGVLYQLLLPHTLKGRMSNLDNTVLVVDDQTAAYPWELISPPSENVADGETPRPIAVDAGFVRQRLTDEYRQLPRVHTGHHALIVGAPSNAGWTDEAGLPFAFSDLPGAREEARLVQDLLEHDVRREWEVEALIGPPPSRGAANGQAGFEQVLVALLRKPRRVLHLSGHGVVDQWIRRIGNGPDSRAIRKSGMVLSNQQLLGAVDIEQMSTTPEFVFINCCYSGREGDVWASAGRGGARGTQRSLAALASSLALKFIDMGARAVIATGWQVDDTAALDFARELYRGLLQGVEFGEAVRSAREAVYGLHGAHCNTWGAYQCYGDPSYRLGEIGDGLQGRGRDDPWVVGAAGSMSADELAAQVGQLRASAGGEDAREVARRLGELTRKLEADDRRRGWLRHSHVRAQLGLLYREIGDHREAAWLLQLAARSADSKLPVSGIEALIGSLERVSGEAKDVGRARSAGTELMDRLDELASDASSRWPLEETEGRDEPTGATQRLALRGGMYTRSAMDGLRDARVEPVAGLSDALVEQAIADLKEAHKAYSDACERKWKEGDSAARRAHCLAGGMLAITLRALLRQAKGRSRDLPVDIAPAVAQALTDDELTQRARLTLRLGEDMIVELGRGNCQTFEQAATDIDLRTACCLFSYIHQFETPQELGLKVEQIRSAISGMLALWPSPLQVEDVRFRFELILDVMSRVVEVTEASAGKNGDGGGGSPAGTMALPQLVIALVKEALVLLGGSAREVG